MKINSSVIWIIVLLLANQAIAQQTDKYLVGCGKADITFEGDNIGLFGYGDYTHRISSDSAYTSRLWSRVISIKDPKSGKQLIYLHADLGGIFEPLRAGLIDMIKEKLDPEFDDACLMMSASHTHCAPSGMSHYALYMASTPGFHPELVAYTVEKMYESVVQSLENPVLCTIELKEGVFAPEVPVAFNRALKAYNNNLDIEHKYKKTENNLALNRNMPLLSFIDEQGNARGFINWFGVHPIELQQDHPYLDAASKGYAAEYAEEAMQPGDVAIFAQAAAGDVMTEDYHNPKHFEEMMQEVVCDKTYLTYHSCLRLAEWNGQAQADKALYVRNKPKILQVSGPIDYELIYVDLARTEVAPEYANGVKNAHTSPPVLGAPFLSGRFSWRDFNFRRFSLNIISDVSNVLYRIRSPFYSKDKRQYKKYMYEGQYPKRLIVDGEEKSFVGLTINKYGGKGLSPFILTIVNELDPIVEEILRQQELGALEEHTLLPEILPIQIIRIGNFAIAGIPTEITTQAYNRLQKTITEILQKDGVEHVIISSYANEYAGYTTTFEEYLVQRYEGGHTLYGIHQLGAFQTHFSRLATEMLKPKDQRELDRELKAPVFSEEELAKRSNLEPLE